MKINLNVYMIVLLVFYSHSNFFSNSVKIKIKENLKNPEQPSGSSGGGDAGEFLRRHQVQEHLFVPLINNIEGDYNPYFDFDIKKYRKKETVLDKNIIFLSKLDKKYKDEEPSNYMYPIELDKGIDPDINKIFQKESI